MQPGSCPILPSQSRGLKPRLVQEPGATPFSSPSMKALLLSLLPVVALAADEKLPPFEMSVQRLDPALDALIAPGTTVEKLAEGFVWSEGLTWYKSAVVFSDVPENIVYRWAPGT